MTRRPRRAAAATVLVLAAATGLSACGASEETGFNFATDKVLADNAAGRTASGGILASALVLVKSKDAIAAALAGSLINRGKTADTLESVVLTPVGTPGATSITVLPNLVLQPGVVYPLGTQGHEPISVPNAQSLKVGHFVDVRLHFKTAGDIKVQVETHKREGFYADVLPEVAPQDQADVTRGSKTGKGNTLGTTKKGASATTGAGETTTSKAGTTTSKAGETTAPAARAATREVKRAAAERAAAARAARAAKATTTTPAATQPAAADPAAAHPVGHGYQAVS